MESPTTPPPLAPAGSLSSTLDLEATTIEQQYHQHPHHHHETADLNNGGAVVHNNATHLEAAEVVAQQHKIEAEPAAVIPVPPLRPNQLDHWLLVVIAFCFQSAVAIAVQSLQSRLPIAFHFMRLAMLVSVAALCVAKYISHEFPNGAQVLQHVGAFSGVTAFFVAITVSFPWCLEVTSWIIFGLSLLAILVCNFSKALHFMEALGDKLSVLWYIGLLFCYSNSLSEPTNSINQSS